MFEMLSLGFMQRALAAGIIISITCAVISVFVILKRLAFIGQGISHSALGGVALGVLLGINLTLSAAFFSIAVAWGIGMVSRRGRISEDTTIGIFMTTAMALGVMLINLYKGYSVDLMTYLFGNILAVTSVDLWSIGILGLGVITTIVLFFKEFLLISFDEELAQVNGLPVPFLYYLMLTLMAITIIISIKIVGIVLLSALLVIPGATGYQLTYNYRPMLFISLAVGITSSILGLVLSYQLDLPSGATIVLLAAAIFTFSLILSPKRRRMKRDKISSGN